MRPLRMEILASFLLYAVLAAEISGVSCTSSLDGTAAPNSIPIRLPGRYFEIDADDDLGKTGWAAGRGREFDLFDTRGDQNDSPDFKSDLHAFRSSRASKRYRSAFTHSNYLPSSRRTDTRGGAAKSGTSFTNNNNSYGRPTLLQAAQDWWTSNVSPSIKNWPRIQCRVEPTTTLKIRKTLRPLKTIVRFGADFNTQLGVWQFQSSWEDAIIGGKIALSGRELQLSKSWQLSVGAVEDLVTRLRFRAAVDLQTWKAYARVGFRTERLSPINIMEGFTLVKQLPLDGNRGNVKLEIKANFALPEPEIEYSTENHRSLVGMGDIEVNIDELNLVLDY